MPRSSYTVERIENSFIRRNEWIVIGRLENFTHADALLKLKDYGHRLGHHNVRLVSGSR